MLQTPPLTWKGKRFAHRVYIQDDNGKSIFRVTPEQAHRLLAHDACRLPTPMEDSRIWCLRIVHTPGPIKGPAHFSMRSYATAAPVVKENLSPKHWNGLWTYAFRRLRPEDRWVYILSQTENLRPQVSV